MEIPRKDDCRPRFLIADDHAIFAEALRIFLEQHVSGCWHGFRRPCLD